MDRWTCGGASEKVPIAFRLGPNRCFHGGLQTVVFVFLFVSSFLLFSFIFFYFLLWDSI